MSNAELQSVPVSSVPACVPGIVMPEWETVYCGIIQMPSSMNLKARSKGTRPVVVSEVLEVFSSEVLPF